MSITSRKEREKIEKRRLILDSSLTLFKEKGFLNVTMQDIASHAEISPGGIYLHFKSKDDIFAAIADLGTIKVDNMLEEYFGRHQPISLEEARSFVKKFIEIYREFGTYFDVLLLTYKGKKSFPDLSEENISRLKEGSLKVLFRMTHYLTTTYGWKDTNGLKSTLMLNWAMLLGVAQVFDAVGRKELLSEHEGEEVLNNCTLRIYESLMKNTE